jgi:ABC-2 type transport system permease protein
MNNYLWLIRREFWENKAIWIMPAAIAGFLIICGLFGAVHVGPNDMHIGPGGSLPDSRVVGVVALFAFSVVFLIMMSIYSGWYLLDCLYADRKDRSILFWKSLPLTDTETVLSKLAVGLFIIPLVYFAIADLTTVILAFIISIRASSWVGSSLWQPDAWLQIQALWIYLIVTLAIWFLPVAGWLMLVSAWATRAVILWSFLPPFALYLAERWVFGTHAVGTMLHDRLVSGYAIRAFHTLGEAGWVGAFPHESNVNGGGSAVYSVWAYLNPAGFFASPATWIGAAVGVALIIGTIQTRSRRAEI